MAINGQVDSTTAGSGGKSYLYVKWERISTWNDNTCGSNIKWELWLHNGNQWYNNAIKCYDIYINGEVVSNGGTWSNYTTSGDYKLLEGTKSIAHNDDGTKTFNINFTGWFYSATNVSGSKDFTLDIIDRYAEINNFSIQSIGLNSAIISYSVSRNANIYCSVDGGLYGNPRVTNTTSGTFSITGLSPNASHSFKILSRATSSGLDRESGTIYGTTKDIGRISVINNFNHGDSESITITNPSGSSLNLEMKIGNTQILTKTVSAGSNTINFTDSQLDTIYRLYGSSNTLTATFILITAGTYTNSKTATITLTGNQKTARVKQGRAKVYIGENGSVKRAVVWIGNNGRKRCI